MNLRTGTGRPSGFGTSLFRQKRVAGKILVQGRSLLNSYYFRLRRICSSSGKIATVQIRDFLSQMTADKR